MKKFLYAKKDLNNSLFSGKILLNEEKTCYISQKIVFYEIKKRKEYLLNII